MAHTYPTVSIVYPFSFFVATLDPRKEEEEATKELNFQGTISTTNISWTMAQPNNLEEREMMN